MCLVGAPDMIFTKLFIALNEELTKSLRARWALRGLDPVFLRNLSAMVFWLSRFTTPILWEAGAFRFTIT